MTLTKADKLFQLKKQLKIRHRWLKNPPYHLGITADDVKDETIIYDRQMTEYQRLLKS